MFVIVIALGSGLFYLIRGKGDGRDVAKSLTIRIVISISLFLLLFLAFAMGWMKPHGIKPQTLQPVNEHKQE